MLRDLLSCSRGALRRARAPRRLHFATGPRVFGSPGTEGRYGATLRELAALQWPTHLDTLVMGAFDLAAAKRTDTTWPLVESLSALQPAPQLKELRLRAVLNTFGQRLRFPALERLWLSPSRVDARLLADLATLESPRLRRFALTEDSTRTTGATAMATAIAHLIRQGVRELGLHGARDVTSVLQLVEPETLARLEVLDLRESLRLTDVAALTALAPGLRKVRLELGDAPTLAKRLSAAFPALAAGAERPSLRAR